MAAKERVTPLLIVHGGAWAMPDEVCEAHLTGVRKAVASVYPKLLDGSFSAVEAVEAAIRVLEEDGTFDAGRGSFLNAEGQVEMDASIMDGSSMAAGAVAALRNVVHPITAARLVMLKTRHVLLVGEGAQKFIRQFPDILPEVPTEDLICEREKKVFQALKEKSGFEARDVFGSVAESGSRKGTVGAVALDQFNHIAAGTSTGGIPLKLPGRVGDSPLIGAGTFADDFAGASATGWGESIMKTLLTKTVCDGVRLGRNPQTASEEGIHQLKERAKGLGGVICISSDGKYGCSFNTPRMARAFWDADTRSVVALVESRN